MIYRMDIGRFLKEFVLQVDASKVVAGVYASLSKKVEVDHSGYELPNVCYWAEIVTPREYLLAEMVKDPCTFSEVYREELLLDAMNRIIPVLRESIEKNRAMFFLYTKREWERGYLNILFDILEKRFCIPVQTHYDENLVTTEWSNRSLLLLELEETIHIMEDANLPFIEECLRKKDLREMLLYLGVPIHETASKKELLDIWRDISEEDQRKLYQNKREEILML